MERTFQKSARKPITKIINSQVDMKLGQFKEELDIVLKKKKNIKSKKAAGLNEIPQEVWKTRKFEDTLL